LLTGLLWTFGLIIMQNQKLNSDIYEAKNHFEQIFHLSPDAVLISRLTDGLLINCNESFTRIAGYTKEDIFGKTSGELNLWKVPDDRNIFLEATIKNGFCENFETLFQRKDKNIVNGLISTRIITLNDTPHIISVIQDITEHKQALEEIKLKNEALQKLNSEKEKLFSIIAHDLKSPFQGLIGYSEILSKEYDTLSQEEIKSFIGSIEELSNSSYKLLENLLEWTRMQTGKIIFNPEYFNFEVELHSTLSLLKHTARNKKIEFSYEIENLLFVNADKNMLSTIVRNLVSNSIKFTNNGGKIVLTARNNSNCVEISIKDTGIGIDKENMDKLFRIDKSINRRGTANEEGSGLGLLLCKEMVEKHGGKIIVESEVSRGTTFTLTIPSQF
jgi:PAS domain S-box-containing protein